MQTVGFHKNLVLAFLGNSECPDCPGWQLSIRLADSRTPPPVGTSQPHPCSTIRVTGRVEGFLHGLSYTTQSLCQAQVPWICISAPRGWSFALFLFLLPAFLHPDEVLPWPGASVASSELLGHMRDCRHMSDWSLQTAAHTGPSPGQWAGDPKRTPS